MTLSQVAAGGSRFVNGARAFFGPQVISTTPGEAPPNPPPSPYAWKRAYKDKAVSERGPSETRALFVLTTLLDHADEHGRTWVGMETIAAKTRIKNPRTLRRAVDLLVREGWLRVVAQTWSSLTAEQAAVGRPVPRRGDVGQAPHLYVLLDGSGGSVSTRPGLVRTSSEQTDQTPGQICPPSPGQICRGEPRANLPPDLDPVRNVSMEVSEQSERVALDTHDFLKASQGEKGDWGWLESWNLVVQVHAAKTKGAYGLAPMEPDLKRQDRKALGECLDGASAEVAAKLRARGMERELVDVRRELAGRAVALYFKGDTPHLRKTKHALRDLPREFHARITEAMQALLRESQDSQAPRRPAVLEQAQQFEAKPAQKPAEIAKPAPMPLHEIKALVQKTREKLDASPKEQPSRPRPKPAAEPPLTPARSPVLPDWFVEELEQKACQQVQKAPEPPRDLPDASQTMDRPLGRPGAPRWGSIGPRPSKMRRMSRPALEPGEGDEPPPIE